MMDTEQHTDEGRIITLEFDLFYLVSVYAPCSSEEARCNYRFNSWEPDFLLHVNDLSHKKKVLIAGDLKVAHQDIDVYDPKICS